MKLFITFFILVISLSCLNAQDTTKVKADTSWKSGGIAALTFNQVELKNWAKGGESSISGTALLNLFTSFKNDVSVWDNNANFVYGFIKSEELGMRKGEDNIDLSTKYGYKSFDHLYYSALVNFKSQFAPGYNYPNDSIVTSRFFSPAYLIISVGLDYKPSEIFSLYFSPATGRYIFISDQAIADMGIYGNKGADTVNNVIHHGDKFRAEFGAYLRAKLKINLMTNVSLDSKLELFNNYTNKVERDRGNIACDWENMLLMKVNDYISASLFVHLIYDNDIKVPIYEIINDKKTQVGTAPRLQVQETFGVGFAYKF